jgi:EmrB/QacA subfamily drug resistance transporter
LSKLALLVAATFFMEFLDATILNTALPQMAASMGVTPVDLDIGVSIYSLTLAIFILPGAWLVDRLGARAVFTGAIVLFTLSSIACGFSSSPLAFDVARAVQGIGGAFMVPVGRLVVLRTTPKTQLLQAVAVLTWPGLTAPLIGPTLGGYLAESYSWRAIFFVNVPLGIVGALLALAWTPRLEPQPPKPFDALGFLLGGGALAAALIGLDRFSNGGGAAAVAALVAAAAILVALFVRHIGVAVHPIMNRRPFAYATFRLGMTGGSVARIAIGAVPFVLPLMFQLGLGYDGLRAGLALTPLFVGNIGIKPFTSAILRFGGFRRVLIVNGLLQTATLLACACIGPETSPYAIATLLLVSGASRSMHFTSLGTLPFADIPADEMSMANLIFSVAFQGGMAFGVGVGAAAIQLGGLITPSPPLAAFHLAFVALAILMLGAVANHWRLAPDAAAHVSRSTPKVARTS